MGTREQALEDFKDWTPTVRSLLSMCDEKLSVVSRVPLDMGTWKQQGDWKLGSGDTDVAGSTCPALTISLDWAAVASYSGPLSELANRTNI